MMEKRKSGTLMLVYAPGEEETAGLIHSACDQAIKLIRETWGLDPPDDCRIYVMTSWLGFIARSAPWPWKVLLGVTFPFWSFRARRTWRYSAAWTQRYGSRIAIGVKPPRLIESSQKSSGISLFVEEKDSRVKVQHVTCHELVHACSASLALPMWLNEGIAAVTVDRFLGKQTLRQESLAMVRDFLPKAIPPTYRSLSRMGLEAIAYHAARAYWLVRYLEEEHPGLLTKMFSLPINSKTIEREIVAASGMEPGSFWMQIDAVIANYFDMFWMSAAVLA